MQEPNALASKSTTKDMAENRNAMTNGFAHTISTCTNIVLVQGFTKAMGTSRL